MSIYLFPKFQSLDTTLSVTVSLYKRSPGTDHLKVTILSLIKGTKKRFSPSLLLPDTVEVQLERAGREELPSVHGGTGCDHVAIW